MEIRFKKYFRKENKVYGEIYHISWWTVHTILRSSDEMLILSGCGFKDLVDIAISKWAEEGRYFIPYSLVNDQRTFYKKTMMYYQNLINKNLQKGVLGEDLISLLPSCVLIDVNFELYLDKLNYLRYVPFKSKALEPLVDYLDFLKMLDKKLKKLGEKLGKKI